MGDNKKQKRITSDGAGWERCVLCNCITDTEITRPVSMRYGYIEGAGQLCRECYTYAYGRADAGRDSRK